MDLDEALAVVVARTGHARFRELCDPAHPDYQPGMAAVVLALAAGTLPTAPDTPAPAAPPLTRITLARRGQLVTCPYRENCGCARPRCWARGVDVALTECEACMPR